MEPPVIWGNQESNRHATYKTTMWFYRILLSRVIGEYLVIQKTLPVCCFMPKNISEQCIVMLFLLKKNLLKITTYDIRVVMGFPECLLCLAEFWQRPQPPFSAALPQMTHPSGSLPAAVQLGGVHQPQPGCYSVQFWCHPPSLGHCCPHFTASGKSCTPISHWGLEVDIDTFSTDHNTGKTFRRYFLRWFGSLSLPISHVKL